MTEHDNLAISGQIWDALNAHDIDKFTQFFAEDVVYQSDSFPQPIEGRQAYGEIMRMYVRAFPDLRFTIEQTLSSGDYVTTRWKSTGTHKGELMGIAPTGRPAQIHGINVGEFKNGKVVRQWTAWDSGALMRQLGVLPNA